MADGKHLIMAICPACSAHTPLEFDDVPINFTCAACGKKHDSAECVACEFSEGCPIHSKDLPE